MPERVIQEPLQTPTILKIPKLDEKVKEAVLQTSLYTDAQSVMEEELEELRLSSPIVTNDWDTVSICRISALNQVIRDKKTYPKDVEGTFTDGATTYELYAGFSPWQIANGGDGKNVQISTALSGGRIEVIGANGNSIYSVDGTSMKLQVKLDYFPQPKPVADNGDYELKVKTDSASQEDPIVAIVSFTPPSKLPFIIKAVLQEILLNWFNLPENLARFNTLFSTVTINNIGKDEDFEWLQPTYMSYACTSLKDGSDGLFGVLCMVKGRDGTENHNQIPAVSMSENQNAVFLINKEVFIKYQFLPSLPQAFKNAKPEDFSIDDAGLTITAKDLSLETVRHGAIDYQPKLGSLKVTFNETTIDTVTIINTNISPGIDTVTTIVTSHTLAMGKNSKDEPIMIYKNVGDPVTSNETHVAAWVIVTEVIVELIIAVVAAVAGNVVKTVVKRIVITVIVAIIVAVISVIIHVIIEKVISEGVTENIPSIAPMVKSGTKPIKWPFAVKDEFEISDMKYYGSLAFYGAV
ncbi:MAG: TULIP family P47-like protein [Hungatella sp.]|jgi:hypothetical protein|nr:TULIP family P47-like protein [Hungatella sp.]